MITILLLWAAVLPPALAAGAWLLARCDGTGAIARPADRLILALWLGLLALSLLLLPVAWWWPLTPGRYALVGIVLMVIGYRDLKALLASLRVQLRTAGRWPALAVAAPAALAVAIYASRPVTIYDTGLYHYPLIHWLSDVGLPPGLALIHSRFGFSAVWFAIPAALNHGWLAGRVAGLMGGLVLLALLMHWLLVLYRCLSGEALPADRFAAWGLAGLLVFAADKAWLISASPDAPLAVLPLVLAWVWMLPGLASATLSVGSLLALGAVCLKPSGAPMLFVALAGWVSSPAMRRERRLLAGLLMGMVLCAAILTASSLISSGCVYYPIGRTCLHWPWSLASAAAADEMQRMVEWARWGGAASGSSGNWLPLWARTHDVEIVLGMGSLLAVAARVGRWRPVPGASLALLMALASIAFGMIAAPDPRFWAGALFTLVGFALWSCTSAGWSTAGVAAHRGARAWSPRLLVIVWVLLAVAVAGRSHKRATAQGMAAASVLLLPAALPTPWREGVTGTPVLQEAHSASGLRYVHPSVGDQCWDAPLPCSPHALESDLRFRDARRGATAGFERAR